MGRHRSALPWPGVRSGARAGPDPRLLGAAVPWIARTGCPWRDLPSGFGKGNAAFKRFRRRLRADAFHIIFHALAEGAGFVDAMVGDTIVKLHLPRGNRHSPSVNINATWGQDPMILFLRRDSGSASGRINEQTFLSDGRADDAPGTVPSQEPRNPPPVLEPPEHDLDPVARVSCLMGLPRDFRPGMQGIIPLSVNASLNQSAS